MKLKYIFASMLAVIAGLSLCSCDRDNDWDYDHSLENEFFFGPKEWGYESTKLGNNNVLTYSVIEGQTVAVPMHFWSEFIRDFNVETFYYTTPKPDGEKYYPTPEVNKTQVAYDGPVLTRGVDYEVVDANGNVLQPNSEGAFVMNWPNAKKGDQNIYIKALPGCKKGCFNLQTFNPASDVTLSNLDPESTYQTRTKKYSVRIFTQNYRVTIAIN